MKMNFMSCLESYRGTIVDISSNTRITEKTLKAMETKCARRLRERGVGDLERVALVMKSPVLFIVNFFAVLHVGAIPVILSKNTTQYELNDYDKRFGIHWLITDMGTRQDIEDFGYGWTIKCINSNAGIKTELKNMVLQIFILHHFMSLRLKKNIGHIGLNI